MIIALEGVVAYRVIEPAAGEVLGVVTCVPSVSQALRRLNNSRRGQNSFLVREGELDVMGDEARRLRCPVTEIVFGGQWGDVSDLLK
jgi:hypothetical protein